MPHRGRASVLILAAFGLAAAACASERQPEALAVMPRRACDLRIWYKPDSPSARVEIVGSWSGWARPGLSLAPQRSDGWRVTSLALPPGEYQYALIVDGQRIANPYVPTTDLHEGEEVTWTEVPACDAPATEITSVVPSPSGSATIEARFLARPDGAALDPTRVRLVPKRTADAPEGGLTPVLTDPRAGTIRFDVAGLSPGKHTFLLEAADADGLAAEPRPVSVWIAPQPFDLHDAVVYHVMLDRFRGPKGALAAPNPPSARAGGTLEGFREFMRSGALEAMGFNMVWLSPVYKNPDGEFPGNDGRLYSSYHGYWPMDTRGTDPRIATEAELDAFMTEAHARGLRVLFDVVPNHVHEQHPIWQKRTSDVGFNATSPRCICGQGSCDWGRYIETCWFAPYMPDLDWHDRETARRGVDDVAFWLDRFDADGVRIDAVPMMPRSATRRILARLRERFEHQGNTLMLLGENFTGPDGYASLRYHLGPFGLDSLFHFPLMWALRYSIAQGGAGLDAVAEAVRQGDLAWRGSGAVMGTFIGNHDVTRFASESAGDAVGDGWVPAEQSTAPIVYNKQKLALGLVYALPGAPVVYYGDEIALAGRADPDSRRVYPAEESLSAAQKDVRDFVTRLGAVRRCSTALRRGRYRLLSATAERYVFARETDDDAVYVVATRSPAAGDALGALEIPAGEYVEAISGRRATLPVELTSVGTAPFSVELYVPASSPCAPPAP